jgi:putative transposase
MTNHVHLLMTPVDRSGISKVMQSIGRRYVQYVNKTYKRSGTLWEDRHKASLVQTEDYLLVCYRYIEMNPVRAGMVNHPGDYPWSSYRHNAYSEPDGLIRYNPVYLQLGKDNEQRCYLYRDLFAVDLCNKQLHEIRNSVNFSMPLGNERFKTEIESNLGKSIGYSARGRPRV